MSAVEMLKKLTAKAIMGEKVKAPEKATVLFTVYGIANGVRKGETNFGPWVALTGNFEAVRKSDGKVFRSSNVFLPEPMHGMLVAAVSADDTRNVQFACNVILKPRADLAIGYEYIAEPVVESGENDPLAALRSSVKALLPAPSDDDPDEDGGEGEAPKATPKNGKKK